MKKLQTEPALVECAPDVKNILYTISDKLVVEQNEGLAFKLHYLAFLIELANKHGTDAIIVK